MRVMSVHQNQRAGRRRRGAGAGCRGCHETGTADRSSSARQSPSSRRWDTLRARAPPDSPTAHSGSCLPSGDRDDRGSASGSGAAGRPRRPSAESLPPSSEQRQHEHPPAAIASPMGLRHRDIVGHTRTLRLGYPQEPMPQRTFAASSRGDRARRAVRHRMPAYRLRQPARGPSRVRTDDAAPRGHDGGRRVPNRSGRGGVGFGRGGAGARPERAISRCPRSFRVTAGSCSVAISRSRPRQCGHARTSIANARMSAALEAARPAPRRRHGDPRGAARP